MFLEALSYGMLLEKSKETGIPFASLLGGAVLEEAVRRISLSEYQEALWLKNGSVLGQAQYKKKLVLHLEYDYMAGPDETDGAGLLETLSACLRREVFEDSLDYGIAFDQTSSIRKQELLLQLEAQLEGMRIPISVRITPRWGNDAFPVMESLFCTMFPEVILFYNRYPTEELLADKFIKILEKLELIRDIGIYYEVYTLLNQENIDARKVKDQIEALCQKAKIPKEWKRMEMIAGYGSYAYMKKRWKTFLRSVHSKEPAWEAVIERFLGFYEPIWQSALEETVFFGDWMPEINRFL